MEDNHWTLDKRLNIGHLFMTASLLIGMFLYIGEVEQKITTNSSDIAHNRELMQIGQKHTREAMDKVIIQVDKNGMKLDRLLENNHRNVTP